MSKIFIKVYVIGLVLAVLAAFIIISCEKDGASSNITIEAGEYDGTYSITQFEDMMDVIYIDTMHFRFTTGKAFYMKLDTALTTGQDRDFCDVTGEYDITGNQIEIIIDTSKDGSGFIYPQTCDHDEIPADKYNFYYRNGEIVMDGEDNEYSRQIILWLETSE